MDILLCCPMGSDIKKWQASLVALNKYWGEEESEWKLPFLSEDL